MNLYKTIITLIALSFLYAQPSFSADAVSFDPRPVVIEAKGSGGVPVGTIIVWPVANNPEDADKWLECNGQSTAGYEELAAIVGASVPDYRGLFLRGHGKQSVIQNNGSTIGNTTTLYSSGNLGQAQGDSIRQISGVTVDSLVYGLTTRGSGVFSSIETSLASAGGGGHVARFSSVFDSSRVTPTANEIRPVNTAVRYLIRAVK